MSRAETTNLKSTNTSFFLFFPGAAFSSFFSTFMPFLLFFLIFLFQLEAQYVKPQKVSAQSDEICGL